MEQRFKAVGERARTARASLTSPGATGSPVRPSTTGSAALCDRTACSGLVGTELQRPEQLPAPDAAEVEAGDRRAAPGAPRAAGRGRSPDGSRDAGVDPLPARCSIYRSLVRHRLVEPGVRKRQPLGLQALGALPVRWSCGRWTSWAATSSLTAPSARSSPAIDDHSRFCVSAHLVVRRDRPAGLCERCSSSPSSAMGCPKAAPHRQRQGLHRELRPRTRPGAVRPDLSRQRAPPPAHRALLTDDDRRRSSASTARCVPSSSSTTTAATRRSTRHRPPSTLGSPSYNTERPHQGAGMRPPSERFALRPVDEPELVEPELVEPELVETEEDEPNGRAPDRSGHPTGRPGGQDPPRALRLWRWALARRRGRRGPTRATASSDLHRGVVVATRARHHGADPSRTITNERAAWRASPVRPPTVGASVLRFVGSTGSISFAGWSYRVGNPFHGRQVEVAIVGKTLQISLDDAVVKRHPIRHDRTKEFGAFLDADRSSAQSQARPNARRLSSSYRSHSVVRVPGLDRIRSTSRTPPRASAMARFRSSTACAGTGARSGVGVTSSSHQLGHARTAGSGPRESAVAQVVEVKVGATGSSAGLRPCPVEVSRRQGRSSAASTGSQAPTENAAEGVVRGKPTEHATTRCAGSRRPRSPDPLIARALTPSGAALATCVGAPK